MAVILPIISEYDPKGAKRAIAQFKQLETFGEKANFAIKKAAVPAAAVPARATASGLVDSGIGLTLARGGLEGKGLGEQGYRLGRGLAQVEGQASRRG